MADGVNKTGLYINGQFPGPTIEANWGDTIQVIFTCPALCLYGHANLSFRLGYGHESYQG